MQTCPLRVLTYTNLFPNKFRPNFGIFIKNRMQAVVKQTDAQLDIMAPVPYFPPLGWPKPWAIFAKIPKEEVIDDLKVYHPSYVVIPKMGMWLQGRSMYLATYPLIQRLHTSRHYQLIDAHWIYPDGWAAVRVGKKLGIPVILSARGNDINEYLDFKRIRPMITWCLQECDHIVSVCGALKDLMISLGLPSSKITVIGNGIDLTNFYPMPKAKIRDCLGIPKDRPILLSVGILEPRKGHHVLIEALQILKAKEQVCPFLYIIGTGPYGEHLAKLRKRCGLDQEVILVGEVPHQELNQWYSAADLLCLASDREGWPNVLLEAMACGTPVVASSVFGIPEVVTNSNLGLIVPIRTSESFALTILEALHKRWNQEDLISHAKHHTWNQVAKSVERVFRQVVASHRR